MFQAEGTASAKDLEVTFFLGCARNIKKRLKWQYRYGSDMHTNNMVQISVTKIC